MNKTEIDSVVCENTIDCCACDRRKKNKSNKWIFNFSIVHEPITADCDEILAKRVKFWIFQPMSGHRRKKSSWPENPSHRFEVLALFIIMNTHIFRANFLSLICTKSRQKEKSWSIEKFTLHRTYPQSTLNKAGEIQMTLAQPTKTILSNFIGLPNKQDWNGAVPLCHCGDAATAVNSTEWSNSANGSNVCEQQQQQQHAAVCKQYPNRWQNFWIRINKLICLWKKVQRVNFRPSFLVRKVSSNDIFVHAFSIYLSDHINVNAFLMFGFHQLLPQTVIYALCCECSVTDVCLQSVAVWKMKIPFT